MLCLMRHQGKKYDLCCRLRDPWTAGNSLGEVEVEGWRHPRCTKKGTSPVPLGTSWALYCFKKVGSGEEL